MQKILKTENNSLSSIIEEINSTVFSKENWIDNNFYKIPEVTYSYETFDSEWPFVNLTLFCDIWEMDIEEFKDKNFSDRESLIENSSILVISKINETRSKINKYLDEIINLDSKWNKELKNKKYIIIWWLKEVLKLLDLCITWLPFEKEKAILGLYFNDKKTKNLWLISKKERTDINQNVELINSSVFWPKLSETPEYIEWIIDYYHEKYEDYKKNIDDLEKENKDQKDSKSNSRILNNDEIKRYEWYLEKLYKLAPWYKPKKREKLQKVIDKDWDEIEIHKNDLLTQFNNHFIAICKQTWNMPQRAKFDANVWSITDTPEGISYPDKQEEFDFVTLSRLARLLSHEIEQHWVSLVSHEELVWNIRWEKNIELAEWTAKLNEDLFEYWEDLLVDSVDVNWKKVKIIDIEKLQYGSSFPKTLMGEILSDKKFLDFLELNDKIEPDNTSALNRYLRHKRTWLQRKDTTYTTWKIKAAKYYNDIITWINKSGEFSDLFIAKVWFHQLEEARYLKKNVDTKNKQTEEENEKIRLKNSEIENNEEKIEEKKIIKLPENLMFHEVLYFSVKQREKRKKEGKKEENKIDWTAFYEYMQKKYPFYDFTKQKIESISLWFKTQLLSAIELTEAAIIRHDTKQKAEKILNRK